MKQTLWKGSDEKVSAMCLGTMYFGSRVNQETSYRILDAYLDAGGNFLDTANCYAFWLDGCIGDESENLLGRYFADRSNRNQIFLATKVGARPDEAEGMEGASPIAIHRAVEGSLKRLNVDYVDLLYVHVDDRSTPLEASLEALGQLIEQGKVRYIGISNITAWRLAEARMISQFKELPAFTALQNFYTYLRDRSDQIFNAITPEFIDMAQAYNDINLLAYGPLLKGAYARGEFQPWDNQEARFNNADSMARLDHLNRLSQELGVSANQLVLAFIMNTDPGIIPIFGASTMAQLNDSLGVSNVKWTDELAVSLRNAGT